MKVAVIGVGRMGRRHVQIAQSLELSIVGICDQSNEALKICEQELDIHVDKQYTDVKQM